MLNTFSYIQYTKSLSELSKIKQLFISSDFGFIIDEYNIGGLGKEPTTKIKIIFDIFNCKKTHGIEDVIFVPKIEYNTLFKEFSNWLKSQNIESYKHTIMKEGDTIKDLNNSNKIYFPEGSMRFHRNSFKQIMEKGYLVEFWHLLQRLVLK